MLPSLFFCFESSREINGVLRETETNADWQRAGTILIYKETGMILCSDCVSRICFLAGSFCSLEQEIVCMQLGVSRHSRHFYCMFADPHNHNSQ
jgi:hypothetical protein